MQTDRSDGGASGPAGPDPWAAGEPADRVYAIPFDAVWRAALGLAGGGLRGWRLITADDLEGAIVAETTSAIRRTSIRVAIRVELDPDAQTRVEVRAAAAGPGFGAGRRRRDRFLRSLERVLSARSGRPGAPGRSPRPATE